MAMDYQSRAEQQGIDAHRKYIDARMASARETSDGAERSRCLADAVAANGMLLRGMEVGFVTGEPNYKAIQEISTGIQSTRAFRSLMADSGEHLAQNGSVDALVNALRDRDRALSEREPPSRGAIDVIRGVQAKVRARTAQPRDYAMLVAANRLSSARSAERAPDGRTVETVRRDLNRQLDGTLLKTETERVLKDPDFHYLMKHEKPESLYVNALRANGAAFEKYADRAEQLRAREPELTKAEQPVQKQEPQVPRL